MSGPPKITKIKHGRDEPILDPDIVIIDTHHHLFDRPHARYLLENYLEDAGLGHNVRATVYMETLSMARVRGPEALRPVGEVEFANGAAAMCASGQYGPCRVAAAIVGFADMTLGDRVVETLDRSLSAAPDRFRGVRHVALYHPDPAVLRYMTNPPPPDLLKHPNFRSAFRRLAERGLLFDASVLHNQIPDVTDLAAANPDITVVLDHMGIPMVANLEPDRRKEVFGIWRGTIKALAAHRNAYCKIGGLGMSYWGFGFMERTDPIGYQELAAAWRPHIESVIEAFGPERCMMETNYPNDGRACGYVPLWNALKHAVKDYSPSEKAALFHGTAAQVYRIDLGDCR